MRATEIMKSMDQLMSLRFVQVEFLLMAYIIAYYEYIYDMNVLNIVNANLNNTDLNILKLLKHLLKINSL